MVSKTTKSMQPNRRGRQCAMTNNNFSTNNNINSATRVPINEEPPATLIHTSFAKVHIMQPGVNAPTMWMPITSESVPISFYFDKQRSVYRIISYDGDRLVINSTLVPDMQFTKQSNSFGLWNDSKQKTVFGLGFASLTERDVAAEWFEKVVKAAEELERMRIANSSRTMTLPPEAEVAEAVPQTNNCYAAPPLANNIGEGGISSSEFTSIPFNRGPISSKWPDRENNNCSNYAELGSFNLTNSFASSPTRVSGGPPPAEPLAEGTPLTDIPRRLSSMGSRTPSNNNNSQNPIQSFQKPTEASLNQMQISQERERKLIVLENELSELKTMFANAHDSLTRKMSEGEKLMQELRELREQLEKADRAQRDERDAFEGEARTLKTLITQQSTSINEIKGKLKEVEKENKLLKELLSKGKRNVEEADKEMGNLKSSCHKISEKVEDLMKIQERLRKGLDVNVKKVELQQN